MIKLFLSNKPSSLQTSITDEISLSNFHRMTITILRALFKKQSPKLILHRNYKNYKNKSWIKDPITTEPWRISKKLARQYYVSKKKKTLQANHTVLITKKPQQAIMARSKLRNKFLKSRSTTVFSTWCVQSYAYTPARAPLLWCV